MQPSIRDASLPNFDEQRPILANAPLSCQRLVDRTFERSVVKQYLGSVKVEHLVHESKATQYFAEAHMGHNINVSGPAIFAIDSALNNVSQAITAAPGFSW